MILMECKECGQKLDESYYAAPEKKCPCESLLRKINVGEEFTAKVQGPYAKYPLVEPNTKRKGFTLGG